MRKDVTFSKYDSNIVYLEDQDKFDPVLYSNLCIPSYVHGYSLAIEYMKKWFLDKFPDNYFKCIHVNGKHMFDDYKRFNKQNVVREKPLAIITPNVDYDNDRENVDLYLAGSEIFLKRSDLQNSFFSDKTNNLNLGLQMQQLKMNFNFRVKVSTKAEQLDVFKRMELNCRVGSSQSEYKMADFNVPMDVMLNIANDAGFNIVNGEIENPTSFVEYLNKNSNIPFSYKLRAINNKLEYFIRMDELYCHILASNKINVDDGERQGSLDNNFNVDLEVVFTMPIPHFFVYFNKTPIKFGINVSQKSSLGFYSLAQFVIPEKNSNGWEPFINTEYSLDLGQYDIDMAPLFNGTDIDTVAKYLLSSYKSPRSFMEVKIFREDAGYYREVWNSLDYQTYNLTLEAGLKEQMLYIAVYVDKLYLNNILLQLNKMDGRI